MEQKNSVDFLRCISLFVTLCATTAEDRMAYMYIQRAHKFPELEAVKEWEKAQFFEVCLPAAFQYVF